MVRATLSNGANGRLRWDCYRLSGPVRREMRHAMAPAIGLTGRDADTVDVHLAVGDGVGTVRARERSCRA